MDTCTPQPRQPDAKTHGQSQYYTGPDAKKRPRKGYQAERERERESRAEREHTILHVFWNGIDALVSLERASPLPNTHTIHATMCRRKQKMVEDSTSHHSRLQAALTARLCFPSGFPYFSKFSFAAGSVSVLYARATWTTHMFEMTGSELTVGSQCRHHHLTHRVHSTSFMALDAH